MRIDGHTNLGIFPSSKQSRTHISAGVAEYVEYFKLNQITHNVCLYPRDEYHLLEELAEKTPNVKHYGIQVLMGADAEHPTDIKNPSIDILDKSKNYKNGGLCWGVKLASHRGWWIKDGQAKPGLDYGLERDDIIKIFKQLPANALVSMHTQGSPHFNIAATPLSIAMYAYNNPTLKFIMNHAGDFGGAFAAKPATYEWKKKTGQVSLQPAFRFGHSRASISAACEYAKHQHNILPESSCFCKDKPIFFKELKYWLLGSDYPFFGNKLLFTRQYSLFCKAMGKNVVDKAMENAIIWLETDVEKLRQDMILNWKGVSR